MKTLGKLILGIATIALTACGGGEQKSNQSELSGAIKIDGSSTVYPITEAVAEEFRVVQPAVNVTVGVSGTGGGFKKFMRGEIDINDASRPIKAKEAKACEEIGIGYQELSVAYDGLAVLINPENDWVDYLTVDELKKIWLPEAQGKVMYWSDVREGWPKEELHLFGPGVASG
ncbi:MAG: substrate-binding domain-containing protein, partial [Flavobacteriales bacterium]